MNFYWASYIYLLEKHLEKACNYHPLLHCQLDYHPGGSITRSVVFLYGCVELFETWHIYHCFNRVPIIKSMTYLLKPKYLTVSQNLIMRKKIMCHVSEYILTKQPFKCNIFFMKIILTMRWFLT